MPAKAIQHPQLSVALPHQPRTFFSQQTEAVRKSTASQNVENLLTVGCPSSADTATTQPPHI